MNIKHQNSGLVIKNGIFLFFRLFLVLFLGFFATRLSLQVLGDEKFGIYNIVGGIIALFAIISMPIRDSIQRFLNVEFAKEQLRSGVIFKTAQELTIALIIVISILYESVGVYLINFVIQYPTAEKLAVNIIFQISVLTNFFGFASLPFISLLFSRENMGIPAICEIVGSVIKVLLIYCIQFVPINVLIPYATIFLIINVLSYCFFQVYCRKVYPECFKGKNIDGTLRRNMLSFSGWSFLEAISGIALTYMSNVFINIFGGVLYNTAYGISKQLQNAVISFSSNVLKASDPQIISNTTTNNNNYRDLLVLTTSKISFLATAFIYIIFHFDGMWLLSIWLGNVPKYASEFCELAILATVFTSISLPYRTTILATGKIRKYFISYGTISLVSMILMVVLLYLKFPIISVMYILAVSSLCACFLSVYYAKKEASIKLRPVVSNSLRSIVVLIFTYLIYLCIEKNVDSDLLSFVLSSIISFATLISFAYFVALNKVEKNKIKQVSLTLFNNIKLKK